MKGKVFRTYSGEWYAEIVDWDPDGFLVQVLAWGVFPTWREAADFATGVSDPPAS